MRPTEAVPAPLSVQNRLDPVRTPVVVSVPHAPAGRAWWTTPAALAAVVLVGVGLRAAAMGGGRNLWIDESMLALNLVERDAAGLLQPLAWDQGAPVGFLLAVKAVITQLGTAEWALRLIPFVGSLLGLVGFAWVAPRFIPRPAALLGTALMALSPVMISYSAECKQYATDAALTVGLFAVSAGLLTGQGGTRRWVALALAGTGAVWFSHPVAFVLGGIGTALMAETAVARDRRRFLAAAATSATWLVSFAACYFLFTRQLRGNSFLLDYWAGHFMPLPPKNPGDVAWLFEHYFGPFEMPGGLAGSEIRSGGLAAVLFAVGLWNLARDRWPVAVAVVVPGLLALLASGLHAYPYAGRLLLFLVPLMVLGVARGAYAVAAALRPTQAFAAVALVGVLVAAPALEAYQSVKRPQREEQLEPVIAAIRPEVRPTDQVYVYYGALPAFLHYTRDNPLPAPVTRGTHARDDRLGYLAELATLKGNTRVWLVFSHRHKHEESIITAYAEALGHGRRVAEAPGAAAYLFDFTAAP
ncbi:glycosyltransferase family 39 protein [bacterium]|nr:glycosyltransferase family 39 protein [bacterium]